MADEVTNKVLLEHMQGMKYDFQLQVEDVKQEIKGIKQEVRGVKTELVRLEQKMDRGFEEAKEHREALQEDLVATMQGVVTIRRHVGMPVASE